MRIVWAPSALGRQETSGARATRVKRAACARSILKLTFIFLLDPNAHSPAVAVAGARQVGQTTLLREVFPSAEWLQFDPVQDVGNAPADPDLFLRNLSESLAGRVVFLDLEGFCLAERAGRSVDAAWLPAWIEAPEALTAQEVNASQLGRDIGVTPQTARRWLDLLSATFQWCEVTAYSGNAVKRVSGKPKGYLADTGLACHAQAISSPAALGGHPLWGALFETFVFGEIRKQMALLSPPPRLHHWRSAGGAEVDLIIERDGRFFPVEFKSASRVGRTDARGIRSFRQTYPELKLAPGLVIAPCERMERISEDDYAMPWDVSGE